jgi:predicted short-subunit dehydrogenase-like oxidoreductase (DUF2520 family)
LANSNHSSIGTVVLLGAGNVAWHLGHQLSDAGIHVVQVYNRTPESGLALASELNASYTHEISQLKDDADLYVLAVSDSAISAILDSGWFKNGRFVVHTAGSVSIDVFQGKALNYGVLYPMQTFTRGKPVDFRDVPLFIEAKNAQWRIKLEHLAQRLSESVMWVDSAERLYLHLVAVIVSNFPNHLYALAEQLLDEKGLSFDVMKPLIRETMDKAMSMSPQKAQTGPAIRRNKEVIERHLAMLEQYPNIREIYRVMSESIMKKI